MSRRTIITAAVAGLIVLSAALLMAKGRSLTPQPPASAFGGGPRASAQGLYTVTLHDVAKLKPRTLHELQFSVIDAKGLAVPNATITVDGGMPEHGHGLPTRPRVTSSLGNGWYEISGLRFNMTGWWELKLTITTPAGTDTVTFNLSIGARAAARASWSAQEIEQLRSLSLAELEPLPPDPSNRFADDPRAAALGKRLFFDTRLSSNGKVSCATCHETSSTTPACRCGRCRSLTAAA